MRPRHEQPVVTLILRDLSFGPATVHELSTATTGVHIRNLREYLKVLNQHGKIRIIGHERRTGPPLPIWGLK